jgi:hypothetical protein
MVKANTVTEQVLTFRIGISFVDEVPKTGSYAIGLLPYLQDSSWCGEFYETANKIILRFYRYSVVA